MDAASLVAELKRRRVFRVLVGYGVVAFAVLQIIEPIMHGLHWSESVLTSVVVALAVGFPIVVGLAWIFDVNAGRIERTAPVSPERGARGPLLAALLVGLGLLAAAPGLGWYFFWRGRDRPAARAVRAPSIAVLPFANLSSDKEQEYFSDGLTEELLNLLARTPGLHVAARTSSFAFKGKSEDISAIAEKLHVAAVLEGSVRKAGDQIRITTQLINASDGFHLWSQTYERKLTDVFAVQDEIARAVAGALKLELLAAPTSKDRSTVDPEAHNQYLLGRQFFRRGNLDAYRRAALAYEKAVQLDPAYAPAWAGLAEARFWVADSGESAAAVAEGMKKALAAAERAIETGGELADGYLARAFLRAGVLWDWEGAGGDLARARALRGADDAEILYVSVVARFRPMGLVREMIAALRKICELDPLNPRPWSDLGGVLTYAGDFAGARAASLRSLEISPEQARAPAILATTYLLEGKAAQALEVSQRSTEPVRRALGRAFAEHSLGHAAAAQAALDEVIAGYGHFAAYQIGQVYAWRGELDRAFEWLDKAAAVHDGGLNSMKIDPLLRSLRGDPRYAALLEKMNLPAER